MILTNDYSGLGLRWIPPEAILFCDGHHPRGQVRSLPLDGLDAETAHKILRERATGQGWLIEDRRQLCPRCLALIES